MEACGVPTQWGRWVGASGYAGPKWGEIQTGVDENTLALRCAPDGDSCFHWALRLEGGEGAQLALAMARDVGGDFLQLRGAKGMTPLAVAAVLGHSEVLQFLAAAGADLEATDEQGRTPLALAAAEGCTLSVSTLLAAGANRFSKDNTGMTPLLLASEKGHCRMAGGQGQSRVVEVLLAAGSDPGATCSVLMQTALHKAAAEGHIGAVEALLASGADTNARDKGGNTPLHLAALKGCEGVVLSLLAEFPDLEAKNAEGKTAMQIGSEMGHEGVVLALLSAGAEQA